MSLTVLFLVGSSGLASVYNTASLIVLTFPKHLHGTAIGFGIAVGRIGSVVAPLLGSLLLSLGADAAQLFYIGSVAGLLAALCYWVMAETFRPN